MKSPIRVAVTGAAGQIGYNILFLIANGGLFGPEQPVILHLLDLPQTQSSNNGALMEVQDCAFPMLAGILATDNVEEAFKDVDVAFLVGSRPRSKGMERSDLLAANAEIFKVQGQALNKVANRNVKVLVVGNPANTNAYIAMKSAPDLNPKNFTAMLRLDHNRALHQLSTKLNCHIEDIEKLCVWGNHGPSMYPDYRFATLAGQTVKGLINDENWNRDIFIPTVSKRGSVVIEARNLSSAGSAANAAVGHMRDWLMGTNGKWITMGIPSDGSYGIPKDIIFGFPVICEKGEYQIVQNLPIDKFSQDRINITLHELEEEKRMVMALL